MCYVVTFCPDFHLNLSEPEPIPEPPQPPEGKFIPRRQIFFKGRHFLNKISLNLLQLMNRGSAK